ncbi:MAG: hypothetical protein R3255_03325 [Candidatus Lokiarchaeia archaeon]|nr:hypothetical protein [Candidatus Lokiarchaeia archaeon]
MTDLKQINTSGEESHFKQWIENPNFTSTSYWTSSKGLLGDPNDLEANIDTTAEQANFEVIGDKRTKIIDDPINIANSGNWEKFNKTEPAINPDTATIDNNGFYVSHSWHDATADQFATVYWKYNVGMDVDMSEYEITSASIDATMYANVDPNIDTKYDTYARFSPDYSINQPGIFDHARFIVEVADLNVTDTNVIAYNQTSRLGKDTVPTFYTIADKMIEQKGDENDLIYYLTKAFEKDPGHDNFSIIVGIEISCEDDYTGNDFDDWTELRIKDLNLTFTYEKKINELSSISWNQEGSKPNDLSSDTVVVNQALLSFKYKINETWTSDSPNSEIQILINNNKHSEAVKLSSATTSFQDAKLGGYDLTYLIDENKNINLSIQVYIADDFNLNRTIEISIDEVFLNVSYTILFADYHTSLELFLNGVNKTLSPSITVPIGQNLTITVRYLNQTRDHIPGAGIQLTGSGIIKNLKEFSDNYSITINVTQELGMGNNYLNIEATKTNFETRLISNFAINVRKIYTEILTVSGNSTINIDVGHNAQIQIMLNDTDNNKLIKGAIVTYTWDQDPIPRVLTENNGIYEGVIIAPPEGPHTITISVPAGNNYEFEDLEIPLYVGTHVPTPQPDLGWLIYTLGGVILGLVIIFTLYQTHFKYPPMVRKIRKLKKKIKKTKKVKPILVESREEAITNSIENRFKDLNLESSRKWGENEKTIIEKKEGI